MSDIYLHKKSYELHCVDKYLNKKVCMRIPATHQKDYNMVMEPLYKLTTLLVQKLYLAEC